MSVTTVEMFCGGGISDNLRGDCQGSQFPELQDENMPPKVSRAVTPQLERRLAQLPVENHMKSRLRDALNSGSASSRLKAIRAINSGQMDHVTSFDVLHSTQEIVTEEERQQAREMKELSFAEVMADVIVYVEVRSEREDRTEGIKSVIAGLGVKVNDRLLRNTTHVIFNEGVLSTYNKAKKWNIPIVSILWFEACRKCLVVMDPERFRPDDLECYEHPELYKFKRHRFIRCLAEESPQRRASKSLLGKLSSPAVTTPKIHSKTTANIPCDTPEIDFTENILVAQERGEKTDTATKKTLKLDDSAIQSVDSGTPALRRSTRRASCTSVMSDTPTPFKSLRKSTSMELTMPNGKTPDNLMLSKLHNISEESNNMEITEIAPAIRFTTFAEQTMIESPQIAKEAEPEKVINRWTALNGNSDMELIKDDIITPEKLIFCSTAKPGSSRRTTMFQQRMEIIKEMTRSAKKEKVKEFDIYPANTPTAVSENPVAKPRRRTLCPIMMPEVFPKEKLVSQPKRRKLFHPSAISEAAQAPKTPKKSTEPLKVTKTQPKPPPATKKGDKRRSTLEFETETPNPQPVKRMEASLVITNVYGKDKAFVEAAVKKLGRFQMVTTVTRATSHLITSTPVRTLNMMRALIRGTWILSLDWVKKSEQANRWLPEEPFELQYFAPAVKMNRCERQLIGSSFKMDLLHNTAPMFVSSHCNISVKDMQELITLCGGRVVSKSMAKYIVGDNSSHTPPGATLITAKWILDSVMACKLLPETNYVVV